MLQNNIDSNADDISVEVAARIVADNTLQTNIDSNASDIEALHVQDIVLQSNIDSNASDIATEVNARLLADSNLQYQLDSNESLSKATDETLNNQYLAEVLARSNADSDLSDRIDSNAADIFNEVAARIAGDIALQSNMDSDKSVSDAVSTFIYGELVTEVSTRGLADSDLSDRIDSNALDVNNLQVQITANDSDILALQNAPGGVDSGTINTLIDDRIDSDDFVDLTHNQSIAGTKTFVDGTVFTTADSNDTLVTFQSTVTGSGRSLTVKGPDTTTSDPFVISTGNALQFTVDANIPLTLNPSGLVGINDSAPSYQLDVDGDINTTGNVRVNGSSLPDSSDVILLIDSRIDSNDFVDITSNETVSGLKTFSNGLVGQGASAYAHAVHVKNDGSASSWARLTIENDQATAAGIIYQDQTGDLFVRTDGASSKVKVQYNASVVAIFDSDGTAATSNESVITREKGDARYVTETGDTMTGILYLNPDNLNPLVMYTRTSDDLAQITILSSVGGNTGAIRWDGSSTNRWAFYNGGTLAALLEAAGTSSADYRTIMTREKADARYVEVAGDTMTGDLTTTTVKIDDATNPKVSFLNTTATPLIQSNVASGTMLAITDSALSWVASFDPAGSGLTGAKTVVTREKGDARYNKISDLATVAQYRNNTSSKILETDTVWSSAAIVTLTDAATVAVDLDTGINFTVTLGGNRTLGNPTNTQVGQTGIIHVLQDGTGSRTLSFAGNYEFASGTAPTLTTTASSSDVLSYFVYSSTRIFISPMLDIQ